jgi:hypothetical protein
VIRVHSSAFHLRSQCQPGRRQKVDGRNADQILLPWTDLASGSVKPPSTIQSIPSRFPPRGHISPETYAQMTVPASHGAEVRRQCSTGCMSRGHATATASRGSLARQPLTSHTPGARIAGAIASTDRPPRVVRHVDLAQHWRATVPESTHTQPHWALSPSFYTSDTCEHYACVVGARRGARRLDSRPSPSA